MQRIIATFFSCFFRNWIQCSACYQLYNSQRLIFFSVRIIAFQGSDSVELDLRGFVIKIASNVKSRGTEKVELSSSQTYNVQIFENETLSIADYEYAKIFRFTMLDIKLWLKDDNISFQFWAFDRLNFNEYKGWFVSKLLLWFVSKLLVPAIALYLTQQNWKCLHTRNWQYTETEFHILNFISRQSLGRKPQSF